MKLEKLENGLWIRPDTMDLQTWKEGNRTYADTPFQEDDTVLDVGAHIGTFVKRAADAGVKKIIAVEPDGENFRLLKKNTRSMDNVIGVRRAVVQHVPSAGTVTLYRNVHGKSKGMHSLVTKGQKVPVEVRAIPFDKLLKFYKPTLIKVDIEYGEYALKSLRNLPDHVRALVLELHLQGKYRERGRKLAKTIRQSGFHTIRKPVFTPKGWHCVAIWERP